MNFPDATGIDIKSNEVIVCFLAGKEKPINLHNPNQIKPVDYSKKYGKLPPLFARATKIEKSIYISGTASIVGENIIGVGDIKKQVDITFDNLNIMLIKAKYDKNIGDKTAIIYFRFEKDKEFIIKRFKEEFPEFQKIIVIETNICRSDLDVEIELMISND
jgi:enamine deaminase RidA (YjgF/YER057c/UK114 family)